MLPSTLWAYHTTVRTPTGQTPFHLAFDSEAVIPVEVGLPSYRVQFYESERNKEAQRLNLDLLEEVREEAAVRVASYQQRTKRYFDKKVKGRAFQVGDLVLKRVLEKKKLKKLAPRWEGPSRSRKLSNPRSTSWSPWPAGNYLTLGMLSI